MRRRPLTAALTTAAVALHTLSRTGGPLCSCRSPLQGHAVFHVLGGRRPRRGRRSPLSRPADRVKTRSSSSSPVAADRGRSAARVVDVVVGEGDGDAAVHRERAAVEAGGERDRDLARDAVEREVAGGLDLDLVAVGRLRPELDRLGEHEGRGRELGDLHDAALELAVPARLVALEGGHVDLECRVGDGGALDRRASR